jgi:hypothetical protein
MRAKTVMTIKYQEWIEPDETTSDCPGALLACEMSETERSTLTWHCTRVGGAGTLAAAKRLCAVLHHARSL